MNLQGKRIVLTGAAGGIGALLATRLVQRGGRVVLVDRDAAALDRLVASLPKDRGQAIALPTDLLDDRARATVLDFALEHLGGVDLLINNAGLLSFSPFEEEDPYRIEAILRLNLLVPMDLARRIIPAMRGLGGGRIVNIGSTFGSIGFAWFAAYSASKAGLRGFSEALRRELADSGIGVTYIAPRAVKTPLNTGAIMRMAAKVKMNMDEPERVADQILGVIESGRDEAFLGFPESLFVRINALVPRLVDGALRKQNRQMESFARGG